MNGDKSFMEHGIECCLESLPQTPYTCGLPPRHVGVHRDYYTWGEWPDGGTIYIQWVDPRRVINSGDPRVEKWWPTDSPPVNQPVDVPLA